MAKSGYKFMFVSYNDILLYFSKLTKKKIILGKTNLRACTVNSWNCSAIYNIHQGRYKRFIKPSIYSISYKLGMKVQTRKPFFFRSKKKKR